MGAITKVLADIFVHILHFINPYVGNYGWSIIILTLLVKIVLLPTGIKQQKYTEAMKVLQPKMKELQAKYKDKPQEMQQKQMELYRQMGVNPLSGCLPLLLQLPIFWALFALLRTPGTYDKVLAEALKAQTFLGLNMTTLVSKQSPIILILVVGLSGLSTYWQQAMVMTDSNQKSLLYIMPLFMAWITATVPGGLAIYWLANNIFSIGQQYALTAYFNSKSRGGSPTDESPRKDGKNS